MTEHVVKKHLHASFYCQVWFACVRRPLLVIFRKTSIELERRELHFEGCLRTSPITSVDASDLSKRLYESAIYVPNTFREQKETTRRKDAHLLDHGNDRLIGRMREARKRNSSGLQGSRERASVVCLGQGHLLFCYLNCPSSVCSLGLLFTEFCELGIGPFEISVPFEL